MLVPVVEILEVGEDPRFVDSIVRLKPLDECLPWPDRGVGSCSSRYS